MNKFSQFLGLLIQEQSTDLYRYKGVLACRLHSSVVRYVLQGVHDMPEMIVSGEWPEGKPYKTQMVVIGRKIDREKWTTMFGACGDNGKPFPSPTKKGNGCTVS